MLFRTLIEFSLCLEHCAPHTPAAFAVTFRIVFHLPFSFLWHVCRALVSMGGEGQSGPETAFTEVSTQPNRGFLYALSLPRICGSIDRLGGRTPGGGRCRRGCVHCWHVEDSTSRLHIHSANTLNVMHTGHGGCRDDSSVSFLQAARERGTTAHVAFMKCQALFFPLCKHSPNESPK